MATLTIGTRSSPLAMWQTEWVAGQLEALGYDVRLEKIQTTGDKQKTGPLAAHGGKGLFIKELEIALLDKRVDLAVHSLKDVPTVLPEAFELAAFLPRADPRDCLIAKGGIASLANLPKGAVVGSCSPRRVSQVLRANPEVEIVDLRGNVGTRLDKVRNGDLDATFLAGAGLGRLGFEDPDLIHPLEPEEMTPAAGQGIVAIEILSAHDEAREAVEKLNDPDGAVAARAERALVRTLEGSCTSSIGALAVPDGDEVEIRAFVGSLDGSRVLNETARGPRADAERIGQELAERLNGLGAREILAEA